MCPAYGKICNSCNQKNHFAVKCRQGSNKFNGTSRTVKTITQNDKFFPVRQGATHEECFPVREMATHLNNVSRVKSTLFAFEGSKLQSIGEARIRVVSGNDNYILLCKIVDSEKIRPILGRKACLGMKIIQYTDNDELRKPLTGNARVYSVESEPVTLTEIVREYASVFGDDTGEIEGEYSIRLDSSVQPVQHAARRVPVAIREKLKETLDEMVKSDIITPVEEPTEWISSMVAITKKDDRLRICLDPKDLNRAIQREHYQLPTIEDIATRLHGAKVFTVLDVKNGVWHVKLDERSSRLTTFNTLYGRYRYKRMPFGISSAPEVFQKKMHQLIEGLDGIEVVADDFVVVGYGRTVEEANLDHDQRLRTFLERCRERGVVRHLRVT